MFAFLSGVVVEIAEHQAVVNVGGVGYLVYAPRPLLESLRVGQPAEFHIETIVREDAIQLYGFADREQKKLFNTLTTVQGVGNRIALTFLDHLSPEQIITAILAGDESTLTDISGVGRKLAGRIIQELKEKMGKAVDGIIPTPASDHRAGVVEESLLALQKLGLPRSEVYPVITKLLAEKPSATTEELLQEVLQRLPRR